MIVTEAFRALVAQLTEDEIPDPLNQPMPLFALVADLCRLAGEPEPPEIAALMDAPAATALRANVGSPARWLADGGRR